MSGSTIKIIVRNDDVAKDSKLSEIETFCNICDKHGFKIMQCIIPLGSIQQVDSRMSNEQIRLLTGNDPFIDNSAVYQYLRGRNDLIAVHGYYHEHRPTLEDIEEGKSLLESWGFKPTYYVPPFNEVTTEDCEIFGLKVCAQTQRLEDYHGGGFPEDGICYLHSWRYDNKWYRFEDLDRTLERLSRGRQ